MVIVAALILFFRFKYEVGPVKNIDYSIDYTQDVISITWNRAHNATGYEVYISETMRETYVLLGTVEQPQVIIGGLTKGYIYSVKIRPYRGSIHGEYSDTITFGFGVEYEIV